MHITFYNAGFTTYLPPPPSYLLHLTLFPLKLFKTFTKWTTLQTQVVKKRGELAKKGWRGKPKILAVNLCSERASQKGEWEIKKASAQKWGLHVCTVNKIQFGALLTLQKSSVLFGTNFLWGTYCRKIYVEKKRRLESDRYLVWSCCHATEALSIASLATFLERQRNRQRQTESRCDRFKR